MDIGIIGLGRMGSNMARRLARRGVKVSAFDISPVARSALGQEPGITTCGDLRSLTRALPAPRVLWLMLPAGEVVERAFEELAAYASEDDVLVDGGNSYYRAAPKRCRESSPWSGCWRRRPTPVGCTAVPPAPGISPRWFTTGSSTE
jgi:6-phosphogluconate dehydrogenase